jgi:hypothetical protein
VLNIDIPSSPSNSTSPTKAPRAFGAPSMDSTLKYVISARYLSIVRAVVRNLESLCTWVWGPLARNQGFRREIEIFPYIPEHTQGRIFNGITSKQELGFCEWSKNPEVGAPNGETTKYPVTTMMVFFTVEMTFG